MREVVSAIACETLDAVVLDVDNGPGFLVYDDNAAVYRAPFLETCRRAMRPGGSLVVWSAEEAPDLAGALRHTFESVEHHTTSVVLGTRDERYHAYTAVKAISAAASGVREAADTVERATCPGP